MKKLLLIVFISITFIACGGSNSSSNQNTQFNQSQKEFLYTLLKTEYLWYNQVSNDVDLDNYSNAQEMINDLRYNTIDKWSYYQTYSDYLKATQQETKGFGMYISNNQIYNIRIDSPAFKAGFKRSDTITKVNNLEFTSENYYNAQDNLGVASTFTISRDSQELNITVTPSVYNYKATLSQVISRQNGIKVGHMIFNEYTAASADEIDEAFTYFKSHNIDELIIDLRYNGGGSLNTASILLDKIAAYNNDNAVQTYLKWNDNYSFFNGTYYFDKDENSLDLNRVFFLTTKNTASASELTINSLKPYMDVKLIGSKTHGKPTGMTGRKKDGLIYWLINFSNYNANNEGEYYNGIDVDCEVVDNINYERTDINSDMLSEALYYIDNGSCK